MIKNSDFIEFVQFFMESKLFTSSVASVYAGLLSYTSMNDFDHSWIKKQ